MLTPDIYKPASAVWCVNVGTPSRLCMLPSVWPCSQDVTKRFTPTCRHMVTTFQHFIGLTAAHCVNSDTKTLSKRGIHGRPKFRDKCLLPALVQSKWRHIRRRLYKNCDNLNEQQPAAAHMVWLTSLHASLCGCMLDTLRACLHPPPFHTTSLRTKATGGIT